MHPTAQNLIELAILVSEIALLAHIALGLLGRAYSSLQARVTGAAGGCDPYTTLLIMVLGWSKADVKNVAYDRKGRVRDVDMAYVVFLFGCAVPALVALAIVWYPLALMIIAPSVLVKIYSCIVDRRGALHADQALDNRKEA